MTLTTAAKVRTRLNVETFEAPDASMADFIADADGLIEYKLGYIPTASDDNYKLAVSTSTGLAAYYAAAQIPRKKDEVAAWSVKLEHMRTIADNDLDVLCTTQRPVPTARSTTGE